MEASALPRRPARAPIAFRSPRLLRVASDERLVSLTRAGSDAAFEAIYDRHHGGILSFCRHMLGSHEEAQDAVQQTFLSAYTALHASEHAIRLRAWLYTIARNRCFSVLRARREHPTSDPMDVATVGLAEHAQQRQDLRELLVDLGTLPAEQRAALVLAELGGLSHDEIAGVLGVPPRRVKGLVFRARESLIASHRARDVDCREIREQLATLTGPALRRRGLRRHLACCEGCHAFEAQVARQRHALAIVLPVVSGVALKRAALPAGATSTTAAWGLGASGAVPGLLATGGKGVGLKLAVAVATVAAGTVGTGAIIDHARRGPARVAGPGSDHPLGSSGRPDRSRGGSSRPHSGPGAAGAGRTLTPAGSPASPQRPAASPVARGRAGTAPGRAGTAPGRAGTAPGRAGTAPGRAGTAPGRAGTAPGRAGTAPGRAGTAPGRSGAGPGDAGRGHGRNRDHAGHPMRPAAHGTAPSRRAAPPTKTSTPASPKRGASPPAVAPPADSGEHTPPGSGHAKSDAAPASGPSSP
jgi:RNA polymerase sigma factor (sigma-70 family)